MQPHLWNKLFTFHYHRFWSRWSQNQNANTMRISGIECNLKKCLLLSTRHIAFMSHAHFEIGDVQGKVIGLTELIDVPLDR